MVRQKCDFVFHFQSFSNNFEYYNTATAMKTDLFISSIDTVAVILLRFECLMRIHTTRERRLFDFRTINGKHSIIQRRMGLRNQRNAGEAYGITFRSRSSGSVSTFLLFIIKYAVLR